MHQKDARQPFLETLYDDEVPSGKLCPHCGFINPEENAQCQNCSTLLESDATRSAHAVYEEILWAGNEQQLRQGLSKRFKAEIPPNLFFVHRYRNSRQMLSFLDENILGLAIAFIILFVLATVVFPTYLIPPFGAIFEGLLAIIMLLGLLSEYRRRYKIKLIAGRIIECRARTGYSGGHFIEVRYKYRHPEYGVEGNKETVFRPDMMGSALPPLGTPVAIVKYQYSGRRTHDHYKVL